MKDSGKRESFTTGSVRDTDEGKPRIDLISPFANRRVGVLLAEGAKKYELRNWEKGQPISRCLASLHRHLAAYQAGENDEDHLAAIACNAMFCLHYEEMIRCGVLPRELDDRACYAKPPHNKLNNRRDHLS